MTAFANRLWSLFVLCMLGIPLILVSACSSPDHRTLRSTSREYRADAPLKSEQIPSARSSSAPTLLRELPCPTTPCKPADAPVQYVTGGLSVEVYTGGDGYTWLRQARAYGTSWIRSRHRGNGAGVDCTPRACVLFKSTTAKPLPGNLAIELEMFSVDEGDSLKQLPLASGAILTANEVTTHDFDGDGLLDVASHYRVDDRWIAKSWRASLQGFTSTGCEDFGTRNVQYWAGRTFKTGPCPADAAR